MQDIKRDVHKRDKIVLEKRATADRSPATVKIEERIGWECLWENALVCERILKLTKWASNSAMNMVMSWHTMKVRLLVRKL